MTYKIKTPILATSANALLGVISGVQKKTMDIEDARAITVAAGKIPQHISIDLKARLAAPVLAEIEGKRD